jgi:sortase A
VTVIEDAPGRTEQLARPNPADVASAAPRPATPAIPEEDTRPPLRLGVLVGGWLVITLVGVALVVAFVGPLVEQREQRALLVQLRSDIEDASNQAFGLPGVEAPTTAPGRGDAVAILDLESSGVRRVVVEGTDADETRRGPGHVVGTAAPGQPGNSVVVGRASLYGGAFGGIGDLEVGDSIVVSTVQGQSLYVVAHVGTHDIVAEADAPEAPPTTLSVVSVPGESAVQDGDGGAVQEAALLPDGPLTVEQLYGPTPDDRLTLVTSAGAMPWVADEAQVVVARLEGMPFAPTPQGGRTVADDGRSGGSGVSAALILALLGYVAAVVAVVWMHRNLRWRSAYLVSMPLLVALTIVLAEQIALLLPAWS